MNEKIVSKPAEFQSSWLSYCGAVAGLLQVMGKAVDVVDVGGYSGYAFLVNVTEGWTDPGSPALHSGNVDRTPQAVLDLWAGMDKGVESLGCRIERYWNPWQYRSWKELTPEELRRARSFFNRVKRSIDRDCPVVVWGLVVPEYGIVNGYAGEAYLVSTFRSTIGQPEDPIAYDRLSAKGGLEALFIADETPPRSEVEDQQAIRRVIHMADGTAYSISFNTPNHPIREVQRYIMGPAAYDEWARVLEDFLPDTIYYEYHSYIAACLHEAKELGASFLSRLAERYAGLPQGALLSHASAEYRRAEALMGQMAGFFPYAEEGHISADICRQGAVILRAVKLHEMKALEYLREIDRAWT